MIFLILYIKINNLNGIMIKKFNVFINEELDLNDLLVGPSLDDVKDKLEGLSHNKLIEKCIEYELFNILPRNKDGECVYPGFLCLENKKITKLPDNLNVKGGLFLSHNKLAELPNNLTVRYVLDCSYNNLTKLPNDLIVGGDFICDEQKSGLILDIPETAKISGEQKSGLILDIPETAKISGDIYR
jgi:hypothetical protein